MKTQLKIGINIILAFFSGSSHAKAPEKYPSIFSNTVVSENYELKKITGNTDGGARRDVLYIKENGTFIVQTPTRYHESARGKDWIDWWKINKYGYLIDVYSAPGSTYNVDILFSESGYVDWVYSGDRFKKKYIDIIDADNLDEKELTQYLENAHQIHFRAAETGNGNCIYVNNGSGWLLLRTKNDHLKLKEKYGSKQESRSIKLSNIVGNNYDWSKSDNFIHIERMKIKGSNAISFFDINNNGWKGKFGPANFTVNLVDEKIYFSAFNIVSDGKNEPDLLVYESPKNFTGENSLSIFELHGRSHNIRPEQEIGLYVLRKRIKNMPDEIAKLEKSGVNFGAYIDDNTTYSWKPVFEGPSNGDAVFRKIRYFNGADYFLDSEKKLLTSFDDHYIPKELDFYFPIPKSINEKEFKLVFGEKYYTWSGNNSAYVLVNFEKTEITKAFKELSNVESPIKLFIRIVEDKNYYIMTTHLKNGEKEIELTKTAMTTTAYVHDL